MSLTQLCPIGLGTLECHFRMAFSCPSGSLDTVHAGVDGLHVMGASCGNFAPFDAASSALPVFDVLHLKGKTDGKEILAIS